MRMHLDKGASASRSPNARRGPRSRRPPCPVGCGQGAKLLGSLQQQEILGDGTKILCSSEVAFLLSPLRLASVVGPVYISRSLVCELPRRKRSGSEGAVR